jgi:hypothetical protein
MTNDEIPLLTGAMIPATFIEFRLLLLDFGDEGRNPAAMAKFRPN